MMFAEYEKKYIEIAGKPSDIKPSGNLFPDCHSITNKEEFLSGGGGNGGGGATGGGTDGGGGPT